MGKSCGRPLKMCLGGQYYDLGHPTRHTFQCYLSASGVRAVPQSGRTGRNRWGTHATKEEEQTLLLPKVSLSFHQKGRRNLTFINDFPVISWVKEQVLTS